jgi:CRISPR system Cascade subunit CasD
MSTLCVRIAAPLVAWGDGSLFRSRQTAPAPSLSAVQGILLAAAGVGRKADWPDWLKNLSLVLRVDRPGTVVSDFQTVNPIDPSRFWALSEADRRQLTVVRRESGGALDSPIVSPRFYLADSVTVAFLRDDDGYIEQALTSPIWTLYAGRKSCPLSEPVVLARIESTPAVAAASLATVLTYGSGGSDSADLDVISFAREDAPHGAFYRQESRRDRLVPGGGHVQQTRYFTKVTVPTAESWQNVRPEAHPSRS